jgi:hypothetical protein
VFELIVDNVALILHYLAGVPPTTVVGSVRANVELLADGTGVLVPRLAGVTVDLPDEEKLAEIINNVLVPYMDRYVRERLLAPIRVPPIGYGHLTMTSPALSSGEGRLIATTAIAPAVTAPASTSGPWPLGRIFIAADFDLVNALAAAVTPSIPPVTGRWSKTFKLGGFIQSTLKADYSATLTDVKLRSVPSQPEQLQGTAAVNTTVHCYAKNLGSVSGKGTTTVGLTGKVIFTAENNLVVQLVGLNEFRVKVDFHNIPAWLDRNIGNLVSALSVLLRDQISVLLSAQEPLEVGRLPSFPLIMDDSNVLIGVIEPAVSTITAPDGRILLTATGIPNVQPSP